MRDLIKLILVFLLEVVLSQPTQNPFLSSNVFDIAQCPCLQMNNDSGCLPYDARFQAYTLAEAMIAFPDLTMDRNETDVDEPIAAECNTPECLQCRRDLKGKLEQFNMFVEERTIGLVPTTNIGVGTVTGVPTNQNTSIVCPKYRFAKKEKGVRNYGDEEKYENSDSSDDSSDEDDDDDDDDKKQEKKHKEKKHKREKSKKKKDSNSEESSHRSRRAAMATNVMSNPNVVGTRYPLSCTTKGVASDETGMVSLCSSCWVWRKLPDNFSPQYINELVCDDADNNCLSGYATCSMGHRTIEVMRNDNGVQTKVTMSAGTYCECKVNPNSALHSLVTGGGLSSPLPSMTTPAAPVGRK